MTPTIEQVYAAAMTLHRQGRAAEAGALYDRILAQRPRHHGALHLKGVLALQAHRYDEARALIEQALAIEPRHALALSNLSVVLRALKQDEESIAALRKALAVDPNLPDALANIGLMLSHVGEVRESLDFIARALERDPNRLELHQTHLFALNYLAENDPVEAAALARRVGMMMEARVPRRTAFANVPDPERPLRVGLLSADLRAHPVGRFLIDIVGHVDPAKTTLFAYSCVEDEDPITERFRELIPNWRQARPMNDAALDAAIVADGIDVLIDLSGYTSGNRLAMLARKPAPVMATWLGYFATTGLSTMDYVLANRWVIPPEEENQWVETAWRMPDTYLCYAAPKSAGEPMPLPALRTGQITFGCFNNTNKLSDETLASWAALMQRVPTSRLVLRSSSVTSAHARETLMRRLAANGLDPARVRVDAHMKSYSAHLKSYGEIDIALDPFPYNGGTTTVEALYMGAPVLVKAGDRYVAHMGESILHNAGLADWIAPDVDSYVALGAQKATDLESLAALRAGLRARMLASPLFDAPRFARNLEEAWRGMWRAWCAAQASPTA